jgi:hypothetical protein
MQTVYKSAEIIIKRFGGFKALAELLKMDRSSVQRWTYPRGRNGTGGIIPQKHHVELLKLAKKHGVRLAAEDFLPAAQEPRRMKPGARRASSPPRRAVAWN